MTDIQLARLTHQETHQLYYLSYGWTMTEIAAFFKESLSTTKRRQSSILGKLGVRNGTAAVAKWIRLTQSPNGYGA